MRSHLLLRAAPLTLLSLLPLLAGAQVERLSEASLNDYQSRLPDAIASAKGAALQGHLTALRGQTTPEAKLAVANAVRVAADLARQPTPAGQTVHYAVPPMSEKQRLPDAYPLDGVVNAPVRIIAARDEYEAGSFVVYPLSSLGKVTCELGAFTSADGKVFPKDNLDLKVVKVWYQNRNAWYSYFGDTGLK